MPKAKSPEIEARLKEALRRAFDEAYKSYDFELSDADRAERLQKIQQAALDGAWEMAGEVHVKPIVSAKFKVTVGAGVSTAKLLVLIGGAVAFLAILLVGTYLILNSPGASRLWR